MDEVLIIGAGPAGLLAGWIASSQGACVRILAAGIGTTHLSPGWIGILDTGAPEHDLTRSLENWIAGHPQHPYALTGLDALQGGISAFCEVCAAAGLNYVGSLQANLYLPTALGALIPAAFAPESFVAGDARLPGEMLIAGPAGWRDFYPALCAGNLTRQGVAARPATFDLPEAKMGKFDATPIGLARLFERVEVRAGVAAQLRAKLDGASRVGVPAVLGLEGYAEVWRDFQERLGVPVFEIPTLPPSVPGMRVFGALRRALLRSGARILLDMTVTRGLTEGKRAVGVIVPSPAREATYRADRIILATGGLYGGGITSNHHGDLREAVFDLPLATPEAPDERSTDTAPVRFDEILLSKRGHPIHLMGVRANTCLQPTNETRTLLLENVRIAGRLLAGYNPVVEGSTEGVWLATAYRAAKM
jgi:glycerol-3-phosphate dehydrogenase subunit B